MANKLSESLDQCKKFVIAAGTLGLISVMSGCGPATGTAPKVRPSSVPNGAVWAGGADGGAYVLCSVDSSHDVNPCSVWNDYSGQLIESGNYRLRPENRAATASELHVSFPDFKGRIFLSKGLVLQRM